LREQVEEGVDKQRLLEAKLEEAGEEMSCKDERIRELENKLSLLVGSVPSTARATSTILPQMVSDTHRGPSPLAFCTSWGLSLSWILNVPQSLTGRSAQGSSLQAFKAA
jgi:hypothetical protein